MIGHKGLHINRWTTYSIITFFLYLSIENDTAQFASGFRKGVTVATENDFELVDRANEANKNRQRRVADDDSSSSPDPNVALKGECVVVCDAKVIASKAPLRNQGGNSNTGDDFDADVGMDDEDYDSSTSKSNLLNKLPCGGLSGRNVRPIAFSVVRSSNTGKPSTMNRMTVTFDYMLVNVGNAFNLESSTFVPPVDGVYSISFNVYRLYNLNAVTIALKRNDKILLNGFADGTVGKHETAQNSGLFHLKAGDEILLQVVNGNLDGGWKFSTFSGYLIFEDEFY